ncbi:MAG: SDR family NAD(P)-dependent oxidoreductase [Coxiellaceae bacterium]|nr:SDR family NAD(P)-dependent oxidoreductase [Coxiellaceae bacterium]
MSLLANKIVFITGASGGIGAASAHAFAKAGAHLLLCSRRLDKVQALAEQIIAEHDVQAHAFALDVTNAKSVQQAIAGLASPWNNVDILVNNAGLARGMEPIQMGDPNDWDEMIDTNIKGLLYVSRAVLPGMIEQGKGHVINLGSIAGYQAYPNGTVYCATKFAVRGITEGMKMDLHGTPIRVTEIAPGMVQTDFSNVRFKGDSDRADQVYQNITPLTAEDIAQTVVFCACQPEHVNITTMGVFPVDQSSATMFHRSETKQ